MNFSDDLHTPGYCVEYYLHTLESFPCTTTNHIPIM